MRNLGTSIKHTFRHDKKDKKDKDGKASAEDYETLRIENEELKEQLEEVEGNLELAKATERFNANHLAKLPELQSELQSCKDELESRIQSEHESSSSHDEALLASQTKHSALQAQMAATEERHKAMQLRLAAEVTSKDSAANDAKAKLSQAEKALATLREENAESVVRRASVTSEARQEVSDLHAKLRSTEEEEQLLRTAGVQHEEALEELRDALRKAKEEVVASSHEADSADSSLVAALRTEIAQQETNTKQELESLRLELLSRKVADPIMELSASTSEVAQADNGGECQAEHLESQIRDLQSEVSRSEALVSALHSRLQLAEVLASASQPLDGQDDSRLRTCVPADVGGSAEREVSAHYDEMRREVENLREELEHTKDENFELTTGQAENEMGLHEARDTNASLQARLLALEAQVAESSEAVALHSVARDADESACSVTSETHAAEKRADASDEEAHHRDDKLKERLEALESEVADLTETLSEKNEATDERLTESQAREQDAEDALERSEAQRTSQHLALVDVQYECDAMREELAEKSELVSKLTESSASVEQVNERSSLLVLELFEKDVTCDSFKETCESLKQELLSKEEAAKASEELQELQALQELDIRTTLREELEELNTSTTRAAAALHEELSKAQTESSKELEDLKEELARESAEHLAAVDTGKTEASENVQLQQQVAKHEARIEHSELLMEELQNELEEAKASSSELQPELDENAPIVHDLRMELLQEKRRYAVAEFDRAVDPSEVARLQDELDTAMEEASAFMNLSDNDDLSDAMKQIKDLQIQCSKLKEDLRCATARADLRVVDEAIRHEENDWSSRIHRPTADFGKMRSFAGTLSADDSSPNRKFGGAPRERQQIFAKFDLDGLDGNDTMLSDNGAFDQPSQDFNPPPRVKSSVQKAVSFGGNRHVVIEDKNADNPFNDEVNPFSDEVFGSVTHATTTEKNNPFDDTAVSTLEPEGSNPFSTMEPEGGNPFSAVLSDREGGNPFGAALSDSHHSSQLATSTHKMSDDVVPREEYLLEVQECIRAREEAAHYAKKRDGVDSDVARELQRAQRALADEEAKSRRLCEHALRAEQSRRSLYHEIMEDCKVTDKDTDLVKLAHLVGRAAKAIAAVSAAAPRLAPAVFSPAQDSHAETSSAAISRTPASPRPIHQEALSGIQGAPGRPDGRPPRSPRLPGSGEPQNRSVSPRVTALPYCQTQGGVPCTPSFDKAPFSEELIKQADDMDTVRHTDFHGLSEDLM